jgi:hypothetical protein
VDHPAQYVEFMNSDPLVHIDPVLIEASAVDYRNARSDHLARTTQADASRRCREPRRRDHHRGFDDEGLVGHTTTNDTRRLTPALAFAALYDFGIAESDGRLLEWS